MYNLCKLILNGKISSTIVISINKCFWWSINTFYKKIQYLGFSQQDLPQILELPLLQITQVEFFWISSFLSLQVWLRHITRVMPFFLGAIIFVGSTNRTQEWSDDECLWSMPSQFSNSDSWFLKYLSLLQNCILNTRRYLCLQEC